MNPIAAICKKEWSISLNTPQGYVVSLAFLLVSGFFFGNNLFLGGQADMRHWFSILPLLFIFFIPAMAMRLLADELHDGTYELLATMPTRTIDIVLGKYFSLVGHLTLLLGLTLLYPFTLMLLGNVDTGLVITSYLGAWLLAACFAAICLFASSVTRHAMIAYILGLMLVLAMYLMLQISPTMPVSVQNFITLMNPISHFYQMLRGVIALADIVLFSALSVIFLSASWFALERRKWS